MFEMSTMSDSIIHNVTRLCKINVKKYSRDAIHNPYPNNFDAIPTIKIFTLLS